MTGGFERFGEGGELVRNLAGNAGRAASRVEREWIGPDSVESRTDRLLLQIAQVDAVAARVGIRHVDATRAGELGVELDRVTHIDHDEKGRATLRGREGVDVVFGLFLGADKCFIPA